MVGIEDVAAAAGVSTATVSRAIRGLPRVSPRTRAKILATAKELGYVPSSAASRLASGKTRTIGVLAPYVDRWFFGKGSDIEDWCDTAGFDLDYIREKARQVHSEGLPRTMAGPDPASR